MKLIKSWEEMCPGEFYLLTPKRGVAPYLSGVYLLDDKEIIDNCGCLRFHSQTCAEVVTYYSFETIVELDVE